MTDHDQGPGQGQGPGPGADPRPDLSAIVVTYRSRDLIGGALESLAAAAAAAGMSLETIVVDNASSDGTADLVAMDHPEVHLVRNAGNVGFGTANNQAFEIARGRWWLLLNPDARLAPDALPPLVAALAAGADVAAAGPTISGAGSEAAESAGELPGVRSLAAHFLFLNRLPIAPRGGPWQGFQVRVRPGTRIQRVGWLSGAAVLFRPEAIRAVGGFDPSIFMYGEDLELGYQLLAAGWHQELVPAARATHVIGGSQAPTSTRWIDGIEAYLGRRGRSRFAIATALGVMAAGLAVRAVAALGGRQGAAHQARMAAGARHAARRALARLLGR